MIIRQEDYGWVLYEDSWDETKYIDLIAELARSVGFAVSVNWYGSTVICATDRIEELNWLMTRLALSEPDDLASDESIAKPFRMAV